MKMNFKGLVSLHTLPKTTPLLPLHQFTTIINSVPFAEQGILRLS